MSKQSCASGCVKLVMPNKARRTDLAKSRMNEKESVEARDRRILEFPLSVSPNQVAKALKAEGCYSKGTTVYYIEYRVRRLRTKAERENASADVSVSRP
jgi:hypothetical protein